jgi:hypothetical protein
MQNPRTGKRVSSPEDDCTGNCKAVNKKIIKTVTNRVFMGLDFIGLLLVNPYSKIIIFS